MYNKFDSCLSDFSHESDPGDYWYDCAILEATAILEVFSESDWVVLTKELSGKEIFWKKRLLECLGDLHNQYEVDIILSVMDTENEDLLIAGIDSLRLVNPLELNKNIKENLSLKAAFLLDKASSPVRNVLEDFIKKIN